MDGSTVRYLGLFGYPAWSSIYLFLTITSAAKIWRFREYSLIFLVMAFALQTSAFVMLSITVATTQYMNAIPYVRILAASSAALVYVWFILRGASIASYVFRKRSESPLDSGHN